jgi:hypothetical protein
MNTCPICRGSAVLHGTTRDGVDVVCIRCNSNRPVFVSRSATLTLSRLSEPNAKHVSSWVRWHGVQEVLLETVEKAATSVKPATLERAKRLIVLIAERFPHGKVFDLQNADRDIHVEMTAEAWAINRNELEYLVDDVLLKELGYISRDSHFFKVSAKGFSFVEGQVSESKTCFVAMWFDPGIKYLYDQVFVPAIDACGFVPIRVDRVEHNAKIDDEIVAQIRRAKFVISDFTGHRGGVYYETGLTHGLSKTAIFTCRKDDLEKLHFDTRQFVCMDWETGNEEDLKRRLINRIRATIPGAKME